VNTVRAPSLAGDAPAAVHNGGTGWPPAAPRDALLLPRWEALDDAALLRHFQGERGVRFQPVIDPEEILPARIEGVLAGRFEFNGEVHALAEPIDWLHNPSADVEWHILLHKFYYAAGLAQRWQQQGDLGAVARWAALLEGWMRQVPPGFIAADVTGRRVQNWLTSLHGLVFQPGPAGRRAPVPAALLRRVLHSLHEQVEFLCTHLTAKRNHRTLELLAIFIAGVVLPEFRRAAHWRAFALAETLANIEADLLADGVHCELSTDYHHLALRNWLQVRTLAADNGIGVPAAMDAALQRALEFSLHVHQPHGDVPSFSDGDVRSYGALLAQGARLYGRDDLRFGASGGTEGRAPAARHAHFAASGYHVLRSAWLPAPAFAQAQHLVFDCGALGEGNHGHFDALSFELAAHGRALVVDPGRYTYSEATQPDSPEAAPNWRVHFRGTAAHNTVCVDGRSQTRYEPKAIKEASRHASGSVRHKIAGPAPETTLLEQIDGAALSLLHGRCASHEYDAVHERCIVFVDGCYWIVADTLRAVTAHDYRLNFQLDALAQGQALLHTEADGLRLVSPGLLAAQPRRAGQHGELAEGWVSRLYGHKQPAPALRTRQRGRDADFDTVLLPWREEPPALRVRDLAAVAEDGRVAPVLAIEIEPAHGGGRLRDRWFHARGQDAALWRLGALEFRGRWLHWREDAEGRVLRALSHAGAVLHGPQGRIGLHMEPRMEPTA